MDVNLNKWHRFEVDKNLLKELSKKSNVRGIHHITVFFILLLISGTLAYYTWGSWWSLFWFLVYGNIYCFSNALWHETGHKTAFQSKSLNEFFYYISCFMAYFEPTRWRYTHFIHHGHTYSTEDPYDHEIEYGNNLRNTTGKFIINLIPFAELIFFKNHISFEIVRHALGIKTKVMIDSIPEKMIPKCILISRIFVLVWIMIVISSLIFNSWLPILYLLLPNFYGKTLHKLVSFTQHAGLARDLKDHRFTSREMYLNPILSFLYWKMEYHMTHHMFPTIPSYNLNILHEHIKGQIPKTNKGLIDAYKDIIPALIKQKEDPNYSIKIDIPQDQKT